jgi:DNA-binding response OmpR family regulator
MQYGVYMVRRLCERFVNAGILLLFFAGVGRTPARCGIIQRRVSTTANNRRATILVVDDEPKILRLVESYLVRDGHGVVTATDGSEAVRAFRDQTPDLIVLDLHLPGLDGMDVARAVRRESSVPIIMLTARSDESDKLKGLDEGADDYITKPFSPRELVSRVRAVLRRTLPVARGIEENLLQVADLTIDIGGRKVSRLEAPVALTSYQFDLLVLLAANAGQVMSRDRIIETVSDHDEAPFDRTIDAHMKNLRRALGDSAGEPRYIETVRGVGYRMKRDF